MHAKCYITHALARSEKQRTTIIEARPARSAASNSGLTALQEQLAKKKLVNLFCFLLLSCSLLLAWNVLSTIVCF